MAQNRFKFQSFGQRIAKIKIDVVHKVGEAREIPDEDQDTFFREALTRWADLNCTQNFVDFNHEVKGLVQSLKQLLFHKDEVFETLCKHIRIEKSGCLDALLDLLAQLTRDLQYEIYPHFEEILKVLTEFLTSHDPEIIENAFVCLAYIFKYLWRYMLDDSQKVYGYYKGLLSSCQRPYIRQFAAESIAFLIRKLKEKDSFLDLLFQSFVEDPSLTEGVGILLFETVKGVNNLFNSHTEDLLKIALHKLGKISLENDISSCYQVFFCLSVTFKAACKHGSKESSSVLWLILLSEVELAAVTLESNETNDFTDSMRMTYLLKLVVLLIELKSGTDGYTAKIFQLLNRLLKCPITCQDELLELFAKTINSNTFDLKLKGVRSTAELIFQSKFEVHQISNLMKQCCCYANFQEVLLPLFLKYIGTGLLAEKDRRSDKTNLLILCLSDYIATKGNHFIGPFKERVSDSELLLFLQVTDVGKNSYNSVSQLLLDKINCFCNEENPILYASRNSLNLVWCCVMCLPYIRPFSLLPALKCLRCLIQRCLPVAEWNAENCSSLLFLISQAVRSFYLIQTTSSSNEDNLSLEFEHLLPLIRAHPSNVHLLQAFEIFCKSFRCDGYEMMLRQFHNMFDILKTNLSSNLPIIRRLTLLILSHLMSSFANSEVDNFRKLAIEMCLNAEKIPSTFSNYLERLLHLRKLVYKSCENKETQKFINEIMIRYLVGNLRINLRPMWQPIMEIINTYAVDENAKVFWSVFKELLLTVFNGNDEITSAVDEVGDDIMLRHIKVASELDALNRPDYNNLRFLMCQSMETFPHIVESRSRDVIPLFFTFLRKEYERFDDAFAPTQNLAMQNEQVDVDHVNVEEEENSLKTNVVDADKERQGKANEKQESSKKLRLLGAFLKLFSQFKNPKALYKEPELYKVYLQLLTHRDNEIQQSVCNCLKTYKFEYLKPYEEHFDKLFQETTFRDELTFFTAGDQHEVIKKEHRNDVVNILIRLLFGKLQRRSGLGISGKASQSARRNIIINFISCCPDEEVSAFIQLITEPFKANADGSLGSIRDVIPLRKQVGFLNMLHTVLTRLSNLILPHADHLFRTLLNVLNTCHTCLEQRDQINSSFIGQLKSIRQLCILRVIDFFEILPDFDFLPYAEKIFKSAVIPQVSRLQHESQHHPSPLLKLLFKWSSSPKYCGFLDTDLNGYTNNKFMENASMESYAIIHENNDFVKHTPLHYVFMILSAKDKSDLVVKMVMKMAENILKMKDEEKSTLDSSYSVKNTASDAAVRMISEHVNTLLGHLCEAVKRKKASKSSRQKDEAYQTELSVLALISSFAKDALQCQTIISILFPTLKSIANETDQSNTLISIKNLIRNCDNTKQIATAMVNLFMILKHRKPRSLLCELFQIVSESDQVSSLIQDMNSWDVKFVDEPNFEKRLAAYSKAASLLKERKLTSKEIKPFLANCLYFSIEVPEMSLRDASINVIFRVIEFVKDSDRTVFDELVLGLLFPVLRNALRSKNQIIRGEYVSILSNIVRNFEETSVSDMKILTAEDPEVDFFENIRHIQIHRRIRAVRLLCQVAKEGKLKHNSLYFFMLPLISHFIFDNVTAKDHNLVTATIEALEGMLSVLPWQRYSHVLRSYLRLLPKEKTKKKIIVRIVVAILDAFHFDLSMLMDDDIKREMDNASASQPTIADSKQEDEADAEDNEAVHLEEMHDVHYEPGDVAAESEREATVKTAMRIHKVIRSTILPQLHKSLIKKSFVEDFHRKSYNKEIDEDAVLRVPIALAIVKLLQKLPKATLHEQLPGVLLRVCQTLKSRARDVRETARDTLVNIASSLGPEYFPYVLKEMKSTLQRGYQLHVLAFTLKSVFDGLIEQLQPGDLDQCLASIIEVLMQDVFGNVSEEKEIEGITGKLHEAKATKSYDSFEIISQFASPSSFGIIIKKVRELLETSHTHKTSNKSKDVLRRIALGIQKNSSLTLKDLLMFIHKMLSDLQPHILENIVKENGKEKEKLLRENIYLVKKEPGRGKRVVEDDKKANLHLLAEFALQLLFSFLKNQRLLPSSDEHIRMLDPYIQVLIECLKSKYNRVIILAAKSIAFIMRFPLPSLETSAKTLATMLFKLLKNYARIGAGTGDNYELVLSSFKAMTVIIRDNKKYKVTDEQLKILLAFVEEDVYDYTRQATAFPLLKAILSRKLQVQEISGVMQKVAELSVTSESDTVQLQCRQLMLQYLLDYPLGKRIEKHLEFYVSHLEYELESGRKSALEMMALIFTNFPKARLHEYSGFFYFPLTMRLVNDESALCRKLANAVLKSLLQKLEVEKRAELYEITSEWFQGDKLSVKRLAIQAIGIFAEVEGTGFEKRLNALLPSIAEAVKETRYNVRDSDESQDEEIRSNDQFLFNTLSALMKILQNCDVIKKLSFQKFLTDIWAWQPTELVNMYHELAGENYYISENLPSKIELLCKDFCEQLKSENLSQDFGDQIGKNLIYLIKVINLLEKNLTLTDEDEFPVENALDAEKRPSLRWLLNKLSYLASFEASQEQKTQTKRLCVFRCLAAASLDLGKERINPFMIAILRPLHRELGSLSSDTDLYKLAQEVIELIKEIVGKEYFAGMYAKVQRQVSEKKDLRKRKGAEEAILDPEKFAKRKQRKNLLKRDQRKRRLVEKKPSLFKNSKKSKFA